MLEDLIEAKNVWARRLAMAYRQEPTASGTEAFQIEETIRKCKSRLAELDALIAQWQQEAAALVGRATPIEPHERKPEVRAADPTDSAPAVQAHSAAASLRIRAPLGGSGANASAPGKDDYGWYFDLTVEGVVQRFRWIEPGQFLMGSPKGEAGRLADEGPQHGVRISEGFWLADSACTQALWLAVMGGTNPSRFSDDPRNPVEQVSFEDVTRFLPKLWQRLAASSEPALPTEAQWEYACRAGTQTPFNLGANISPRQVNYDGNYPYANAAQGGYRERTVPVKSLPPNAWGLYEMHGNVWEWCADGPRSYADTGSDKVAVDPLGPTESASRALRGGSWINYAQYVRSAYRYAGGRDRRFRSVGFRLALRS